MNSKPPIHDKMWKSAQNIIMMFIGSAAEFPLNPENHWLFYTMALPNNPQARFVHTILIQQKLTLATEEERKIMAEKIRAVHTKVEKSRSTREGKEQKMSNNAFLQVGDMTLAYGIKGYEYLHHTKLTDEEKEYFFSDHVKFIKFMGIEVPDKNYADFMKGEKNSIRNI